MSVDPAKPSASEPTPPTPPADLPADGSPAEVAEAIRLKKRFKKGGGTEPAGGGKPDQTIHLLSTLLQDLIAKKETPGAPDTEGKSNKYHRLSKTGSGVAPSESSIPATPADSAPASDTPAGTAPAAGGTPPQLSAPAPAKFRAAPIFTSASASRRQRRSRLLTWLGALALAAGAYLAGSRFGLPGGPAGSSAKRPPPPTGAWTDAMITQLGLALAADQGGDLPEAVRLASALKKPDGGMPPGLDLYLASLQTRQNRFSDVEENLTRSVDNAAPERAAAVNEGLAFNFSRNRDFQRAVETFDAASRAAPFSAPLFYHWGEALRHQGNLRDAAAKFRRALERIPAGQPENDSLRECINLKLRLSLVEAGQDGEFQAELDERLKAPVPSGYWLLTAAAVALQHNNLPDATGLLGRARDALGPAQFGALLDDYFFRAYASRKELADFFPADPAARRVKLLTTMADSVEP